MQQALLSGTQLATGLQHSRKTTKSKEGKGVEEDKVSDLTVPSDEAPQSILIGSIYSAQNAVLLLMKWLFRLQLF